MIRDLFEKVRGDSRIVAFLILAGTAGFFGLNLYGFGMGITTVLPDLLYFPIITCAYYFPRRGIFFALVVAVLYFLLSLALVPSVVSGTLAALTRSGLFILVAAVVTYLSEQMQRQTGEVRTLSAEYKAIIDNAPAMIWYKDTNNVFVRVNPAVARVFGLPIDRIEGRSGRDLFPAHAEQYYRDDREVIQSATPRYGIIEPMVTARGEHRWVQVDKIPLKNAGGTVTGILVFGIDITERKLAEDALALVNRKLNLLSSITRHDIGNQLMALNAFIEITKDAIESPAELQEYFAKERAIVEVLSEEVEFSRDYEVLGVKSPLWQDVATVIWNTAANLGRERVSITVGFSSLEIYADPLLGKVFYNLIDNALHYGGASMTAICISSREQDPGQLVIVVEDNGAGIAEQDKPRLFAKGFGKHTGLGLFLSREILGITGLTIAETGIPGKGARFEITVPRQFWRFHPAQ